jgi:hypothetical protein
VGALEGGEGGLGLGTSDLGVGLAGGGVGEDSVRGLGFVGSD